MKKLIKKVLNDYSIDFNNHLNSLEKSLIEKGVFTENEIENVREKYKSKHSFLETCNQQYNYFNDYSDYLREQINKHKLSIDKKIK